MNPTDTPTPTPSPTSDPSTLTPYQEHVLGQFDVLVQIAEVFTVVATVLLVILAVKAVWR